MKFIKFGITPEQFTNVWNDLENYPKTSDVVNKFGWTYAIVSNHAFKLRNSGFSLVKRKTGRPQGINREYIRVLKGECKIKKGIVEKWEDRKDMKTLAASLNISRTTLYNKINAMNREGVVLDKNKDEELIAEVLKVWQDDTIEVSLSDIKERFGVTVHFIETRIYPITHMKERSKMNLFVRNRQFIEDWNHLDSYPSVNHLLKYGTRFGVCMKAKDLRKQFSFIINRKTKK